MVLMLTKFCCGCSLKTGAMIISIGLISLSVISLFGSAIMLGAIDVGIKQAQDNPDSESIFVKIMEGDLENLIVAKAALITLIVILVIEIIMNILLIVGVKTDKEKLILPWIIFYSIILTINAILLGGGLILDLIAQDFSSRLWISLGMIALLPLYVYFVIVVYSLYIQLKGDAIQAWYKVGSQLEPEELTVNKKQEEAGNMNV